MPSRRSPGKHRFEGLLLAPGAGASRDHHTLVALEEGLDPLPVGRFDFPYRKEGRRTPDRPPKAIACVKEEAVAMAANHDFEPEQLLLGGRSYGGRMCSLAVAEGLPAAGLVLLSYPLHPPGKPESLRTEHFSELVVPCLFVSGDRDPFGSPAELGEAVKAVPGPVTEVWLHGGHDPKNQDEAIIGAVRDWIDGLR